MAMATISYEFVGSSGYPSLNMLNQSGSGYSQRSWQSGRAARPNESQIADRAALDGQRVWTWLALILRRSWCWKHVLETIAYFGITLYY